MIRVHVRDLISVKVPGAFLYFKAGLKLDVTMWFQPVCVCVQNYHPLVVVSIVLGRVIYLISPSRADITL